jgi:hypothetical protein
MNVMGGVFGLLFMWLLTFLMVSLIWRLYLKYDWRKSLLVGATYLFIPLRWLRELDGIRRKWFKILLGFGAIIMQFDMLNEVFYSFFPSRLIIFDFMPFGDGSNYWYNLGYTREQIRSISYGVWAVLLVFYLAVLFTYYRFIRAVRRQPVAQRVLHESLVQIVYSN